MKELIISCKHCSNTSPGDKGTCLMSGCVGCMGRYISWFPKNKWGEMVEHQTQYNADELKEQVKYWYRLNKSND